MKKAIILISGGADSATTLAIALKQQYKLYAISFDYSQRHKIELVKAQELTRNKVVSHKIIKIDCSVFQASALSNHSLSVPKFTSLQNVPKGSPITYVPGRNNLFLSYALSYAETLNIYDIFIGVHKDDFASYPDCRPEFIAKFQELANLATATTEKFSVHAPLLNLSKTQIIHEGLKLDVDYSCTISCYNPDENGISCRECLACLTRLDAFANNQALDPVQYIAANKS
jgi:7-cyano-7-deazaguanine synthase